MFPRILLKQFEYHWAKSSGIVFLPIRLGLNDKIAKDFLVEAGNWPKLVLLLSTSSYLAVVWIFRPWPPSNTRSNSFRNKGDTVKPIIDQLAT